MKIEAGKFYTALVVKEECVWTDGRQHLILGGDKCPRLLDDCILQAHYKEYYDIPEGFTAYHGGDCPVDACGVMVEVIFRDGDRDKRNAGVFRWSHYSCGSDVIAYRVVREPITDTEFECVPKPVCEHLRTESVRAVGRGRWEGLKCSNCGMVRMLGDWEERVIVKDVKDGKNLNSL